MKRTSPIPLMMIRLSKDSLTHVLPHSPATIVENLSCSNFPLDSITLINIVSTKRKSHNTARAQEKNLNKCHFPYISSAKWKRLFYIVPFSFTVESERIGALFSFFIFPFWNDFHFPHWSVMIAFIRMKKCKIKFYWDTPPRWCFCKFFFCE